MSKVIVCSRTTNSVGETMQQSPPRTIKIESEAIPHPESGWICTCGRWTNEDKEHHTVQGSGGL